ncbi:MAG: TetR/AcrR family transcriptional regulator [Halothermotrichaceae bacterium]
MTQRMSSVERKKEIMASALEIIYKEGFPNLTIRNIADSIGISEAAIYRHFNSKKEIVAKLADIVFNQNQLKITDNDIADPFELLKKIMVKQVKILEERPFLTSILFQEGIFAEYPDIKKKFNTHRKKNENIIKEIIEVAKEKGLILSELDPEVFSVLYMGSLRVVVLKWRSADFSYSLEKKVNKIIKQLFEFIKK